MKEFLYCKYPNEYGLAFFSKYYVARCPDKGSIKVNPDETSEIEFLTVAEIREKLVTEQQLFKSDYSAAFKEFCKYLKKYKF